jgi:hypothetical protein
VIGTEIGIATQEVQGQADIVILDADETAVHVAPEETGATTTEIKTTRAHAETTDVIMTGIVMNADSIEKRIERAKENPNEWMKDVIVTLQNEQLTGTRTSLPRNLHGTVSLNAHKRLVRMLSLRFGRSRHNAMFLRRVLPSQI